MKFLEALQNSALSTWVLGSDSIWAYPTVLTLHTVGLAILVGASAVIDLRLLGFGSDIPLQQMRNLFRFVWAGFVINLLSGVVLFVAEAVDRAKQPIFLIKLCLVITAFIVVSSFRSAFNYGVPAKTLIPQRTRMLAASSLFLWAAAIIA